MRREPLPGADDYDLIAPGRSCGPDNHRRPVFQEPDLWRCACHIDRPPGAHAGAVGGRHQRWRRVVIRAPGSGSSTRPGRLCRSTGVCRRNCARLPCIRREVAPQRRTPTKVEGCAIHAATLAGRRHSVDRARASNRRLVGVRKHSLFRCRPQLEPSERLHGIAI